MSSCTKYKTMSMASKIWRPPLWFADCFRTSSSLPILPNAGFIQEAQLSTLMTLMVLAYYRCMKLPSRTPLIVTFSRDVNTDIEALRLASRLACLPGGTFHSIFLCFSRYKPVSPGPLAKLLAILPQTQCYLWQSLAALWLSSCYISLCSPVPQRLGGWLP